MQEETSTMCIFHTKRSGAGYTLIEKRCRKLAVLDEIMMVAFMVHKMLVTLLHVLASRSC